MEATDLKRLLLKHGWKPDDGIASYIIEEARFTGLPLSYGIALIEKESGGRNVFGNDPVRNPIKRGKVTRARYMAYKAFRKAGLGMQGVGPGQLTWYELQDEADRLGGCWKPRLNIRVAFTRLHALTKAHGKRDGARRYNGSGAAAEAYAKDFVLRQERWHDRLT